MKAGLAHFYGWSDDYIDSLPVDVALDYWHSITAIEARQALVQANLIMMPHVDGKERERYHKELEKLANPVRKSQGKKLTNKELMEVLSRR